MNLLKDILTYVRRILKTPSDAVVTDNLLIDYINRFWIMDVDARLQLFDLKTKYQFITTPGVDQYNMPLYNMQSETPSSPNAQDIAMYPVYQGFLSPCYINGVQVSFHTQKNVFFNSWPNIVQNLQVVAIGNGTAGPYNIQLPIMPNFPNPPNPPLQGILRGHIDITGVIETGINVDPPLITAAQLIALDPFIQKVRTTSVNSGVYITSIDSTGANVVVADSGQFLETNINYGLLMQPGNAPYGNLPLGTGGDYSTTVNTINYFTGEINVTFPKVIPAGNNINVQCYYFQTGLPRGILYYNNTLTLRSPPDKAYLVELDSYLTPAAFFQLDAAVPFAYMCEYIALGAARKMMIDTQDETSLAFYEPYFKEQEILVWKRSQRQWTATRTETIYSQGYGFGQRGYNNFGGNIL